MFSWAKELLSPSVQTGKPVEASNDADSRKRAKSDADANEMTEEGFVCIGKSSFYKSPELPAIHQSYTSPYPPGPTVPNPMSQAPFGGPSTLYPTLPYQSAANNELGSVPDNSDLVRQIPFTTRSGVQMKLGGFVQQKPFEIYLHQLRYQSDRLKFEYDFNFERGVLREVSQQQPGNVY